MKHDYLLSYSKHLGWLEIKSKPTNSWA